MSQKILEGEVMTKEQYEANKSVRDYFSRPEVQDLISKHFLNFLQKRRRD